MANTTNFGWETPDDTDLVKDGAAAIRTLGSAIDTSMVDLKGGTTGQLLSKNSNTDMDFTWTSSSGISSTIFDAKGDIIAASAADSAARLAVGTDGQVLTADSTAATGLKWSTPAAGGKVLQVVSAVVTANTSTTSTTYVDSGLTATITPTSSSSKVMVLIHMHDAAIGGQATSTSQFGNYKLVRGTTDLSESETGVLNQASSSAMYYTMASMGYIDSPATTSATTYKLQYKKSNGTIYISQGTGAASIILMEIGA